MIGSSFMVPVEQAPIMTVAATEQAPFTVAEIALPPMAKTFSTKN
jgi:hypothetical protein